MYLLSNDFCKYIPYIIKVTTNNPIVIDMILAILKNILSEVKSSSTNIL
jgi:hypothetical protein